MTSPRRRLSLFARTAALAALSFASACTTTKWQALRPGIETEWRGLLTFCGERAFVLARDADAAAEAYAEVLALAACFDATTTPLQRGLVIALSAADPLLVDDPEQYAESLSRWHSVATGRTPHSRGARLRTRPHGNGPDDPEMAPRLAVRLLAAGVPKDEPALGLPPGLREQVAHVVVLPTTSCLATTCDAIVDVALEREDVGWLQLQAMKVLVGHPATLMAEQMQLVARAMLLDAWCSSQRLDSTQAIAIAERAGVAKLFGDMHHPTLEAPADSGLTGRFALLDAIPDLHLPDGAGSIASSGVPSRNLLPGMRGLGWHLLVELSPEPLADLAPDWIEAGGRYEWIHLEANGPTHAAEERLHELVGKHGNRFTLVFSADPAHAERLRRAVARPQTRQP